MISEESGYMVLGEGAAVSHDGLLALTDAELGLILGGNASDVTGSSSQVMDHVGHVSSWVTVGSGAGALAGPGGAVVDAATGFVVGVAYEIYEHNTEAINNLEQQNRSNII